MPNKKPQGNVYDRIFRENAQHIFIPLVKQVYDFAIESYTVLNPKFPSTSENEVDFLYELHLKDGQNQLLHIEFQSKNDTEMLARMQEYHSKIYKKYKQPINSLVINLGEKPFTASNVLTENEVFYGYEIINLFNLSAEELLSSQVPEVVVLAILSNYPTASLETVLRTIVKKLKTLVVAEKDMSRYVNQLFNLARLRKFEIETKNVLDKMLIEIDIEQDFFYKQGIEIGEDIGKKKGKIEGKIEGIELSIKVIELHKKGTTPETIAKNLNIELEKVNAIIKAF